jgi:transposase
MSALHSRHRHDQDQSPEAAQPDEQHQQYRKELKAFLATLSHEQRRLYSAVESNRLGRGGVASVAKVTGLCEPTIARGRRELAALLEGKPIKKERKPVRGRPRVEEKYAAITSVLEEMLADEVAGDPMGEQKWVRSSVRKLAERLKERGFSIAYNTVWHLLKRMGFSLRTAVRRRRGVCKDPAARDEQFRYIASQRKAFIEARLPVISVDTKKKELIGNFRNPGRLWCRQPPEVDEHSFPSQAEGVAVPFGVYDLGKNRGYVVVGTSHNTPEFAVSVIARWWEEEGHVSYPRKRHLLILADGGGANGRRSAAWRLNLQEKVCDRFRLTVTVCHYPPGCSKWNPVERRLFSEISKNWEGRPLRSFSIMLGYIRGTTTTTGLTVKAYLDDGIYKKGQKVTREDVRGLALERHPVCSDWNYTIRPRKNGANHA